MMGEETFHPDTRVLLHYSRALAGHGAPPKGVSGADRLSERLLVMDRFASGRLLVRTCGGELITLFGRDLRDQDFCDLWPDGDQPMVRAFAEAVCAAGEPGIVRATGETANGIYLGLEALLTPLQANTGPPHRLLGLLQPLGGEAFLEGRALKTLRLGAIHPPVARARFGPRLVVSND
jgi:hypothetical protein